MVTMMPEFCEWTGRKIRHRTMARHNEEDSFLSLVTAICTTEATHFYVAEDDNSRTKLDRSEPIVKMMIEYCGSENVRCVHPMLLFNTDDTGIWTYVGKSKEAGKRALLFSKNDTRTARTNTVPSVPSHVRPVTHIGPDPNAPRGLRFRLTFTVNAAGMMLPFFIQIHGLTSDELDVDVVTVDITNFHEGESAYLCSSRRTADSAIAPETAIFHNYRTRVLHPAVKKIRRTYFDCDTDDVPTRLAAVSWIDGALSQLAAVVAEDMQLVEEQLKLSTNKHGPRRSGITQSLDLCELFPNVHRNVTNNTAELPDEQIRKPMYVKKLKQESRLHLS